MFSNYVKRFLENVYKNGLTNIKNFQFILEILVYNACGRKVIVSYGMKG